MRTFVIFVVSAVVFLAVYFFSYWILFAQIFPDSIQIVPNILALASGVAAAVMAWRGMNAADQGIIATVATWATVTGAVGFCGGFFGPMIFTPDANQGPLFGIFISGPLGFIGGGLCGFIYALIRRSRLRAI